MEVLLLFLAGLIFIECIRPILVSLLEWFQSAIGVKVAKNQLKLVHIQKQVDDIQTPQQEISTPVVGFSVDSEEVYDEEDD